MKEKNTQNTKSSLTMEEIKEIAPNWTEGWTEEELQEIASNYTAEEIIDIESRLPELRGLAIIATFFEILGCIIAIAIAVPLLCILAGILIIDTSSPLVQFAGPMFLSSLFLLVIGLSVYTGSEQVEEKLEKFEVRVK